LTISSDDPESFAQVPFDIPADLGPYIHLCIENTQLLELFNRNRQDFIDRAGLLYDAIIRDQDRGCYLDRKTGFASFCDALTAEMLAAPSQTLWKDSDESGKYSNFIGAAILKHLKSQNLHFQDLYSLDGAEKHAPAWRMCLHIVMHTAVEAFKSGIGNWDAKQVAQAKQRCAELQNGDRKLKTVDGPSPLKF
jgi:hypothetical protein